MGETLLMTAASGVSSSQTEPTVGLHHPRYGHLLDVSKRANEAALLLYVGVHIPSVKLGRSRKAVKAFAGYSKVMSIAKEQRSRGSELLLLNVAENTLKTLSQVYVVWTSRPPMKPFSEVEKKAFAVLVKGAGSAGSWARLPDRDPGEAVAAVTKRIEALGSDVAALVEAEALSADAKNDVAAFRSTSEELLKRAGGALSLADAAKRLKVSPQRTHKRIQDGTLLGMSGLDGNILVPAFQIEETQDGVRILLGIERAVRPFVEAGEGGWAALQWLLDEDPNLGSVSPLSAIKAGRLNEVERAARAYVGFEDG